MTRSLYTKFLLGYLVFGLLGFIFIATMSSEITYQYLLEEKSDSLYDEANLLASTYSDIYQAKISACPRQTRSCRPLPPT